MNWTHLVQQIAAYPYGRRGKIRYLIIWLIKKLTVFENAIEKKLDTMKNFK
jgi:hypothetical protein